MFVRGWSFALSFVVSLGVSLGALGCVTGAQGGDEGEGGEGGLGTGPLEGPEGQGGEEPDGEGGARPAFGACDGYATEVVEVAYGPGAGFGQEAMPDVVLGPPRGAGAQQGSLDVVTLGNGGSIVLGLGAQRVVDGPGPDLVVFENAFYAGGNPAAPFAELAAIELSDDGETWHAFPCTATELPFDGCAGWHPVYANPGVTTADPHDPAEAGGEAFDLADLGLAEARFVRVTDRADLDGFSGSFDLDAIALVNWSCDAR